MTNPELAVWCGEQAAPSRQIGRYDVAVLNPAAGSVEPMNMAIFDGRKVYLAFAGATESQIRGVQPVGTELAQFLQARFDERWRQATPIAEFVRTSAYISLLPPP